MNKAPAKTKPIPKPKTEPKKPKKETPSKDEPPKTKKVLVTAVWLANALGVTDRRIRQLQQEGVIKPVPGSRDKDGVKYDVLETLINAARYYREKADSRKSGDSEEMKAEKLKQITAKRKLEELKLKQIEGELHKAGDIEKVMGAVLSRLRINLLAIPTGIAPALREETDINAIAEKISGRICRALNEVVDLDLDTLTARDREEGEEKQSD